MNIFLEKAFIFVCSFLVIFGGSFFVQIVGIFICNEYINRNRRELDKNDYLLYGSASIGIIAGLIIAIFEL